MKMNHFFISASLLLAGLLLTGCTEDTPATFNYLGTYNGTMQYYSHTLGIPIVTNTYNTSLDVTEDVPSNIFIPHPFDHGFVLNSSGYASLTSGQTTYSVHISGGHITAQLDYISANMVDLNGTLYPDHTHRYYFEGYRQ